MPSLWRAEFEPLPYPPLDADIECDLIVIGSGIAGLSSAYEAARFGAKVIVIDRGDITGGMTARTTAHLASEIDDRYFDLIKAVGETDARLYHESQVAAINRIETVCNDEGIDADFARLHGYLVGAEPSYQSELEQEYDACRTLGVDVEWSRVRARAAAGRYPGAEISQTRVASIRSNIAPGWHSPSKSAAGCCSVTPPMSATTRMAMELTIKTASGPQRSEPARRCSRPMCRSTTGSRSTPSKCRCAPM